MKTIKRWFGKHPRIGCACLVLSMPVWLPILFYERGWYWAMVELAGLPKMIKEWWNEYDKT